MKFFSLSLLSLTMPVLLTAQTSPPTNSGYDVFLLAGQSNMVGYGSGIDSSSDAATNGRIFQWDSATNQIVLAADPLYTYQGKQFFTGMGMTFAKAYLSSIPSNRQVLLVNSAIGATSFADGTWIAGSGIGATTAVQSANAAIAAAGPGARLAGILWHQGESDVQENGASAYQMNLQNLISYFRSNITGASTSTPFVAGEFAPAWLASQLANATYAPQQFAILENIRSLPDTEPNTAWASSALLPSDLSTGLVHFSALSQRALGRRYAERFFLASQGLPQPQLSLKSWAGAFYDDGRGLLALAPLPTNSPPAVTGTVSPVADPLRGSVAQIYQGQGSLSSSLPAGAFNASYTKMAWFNPGAVGYSNYLISAANPGQTHFLQAQTLTSSTIVLSAGHSSAASSANIAVTVSAAAGTWMHIALVYDAGANTMTLYLNGVPIASQSNIAPAPPSTSTSSVLPVLMGTLTGSGTSGLDGEIAGNRVWTSALSAAQIATIYSFESIATPAALSFGSVSPSSPATQSYTFTPASSSTVAAVSILTEGVTGGDFSLANATTCAPAAATPCAVSVTFTPKFPGLRRGALLLTDSTGAQTTVFLSGVGALTPSYNPPSQSVLASGLPGQSGLAVDGAANVYSANASAGTVTEVNPSGSLVRTITGLNSPSGVAVDGAGNLYITESASAGVIKVLPGTANFTTVATGFNASKSPQGPSIDAAGNVYLADTADNAVLEISASGQANVVSTGSLTLSAPSGTALDAAGNLYIADSANGRIVEVPSTGAGNSKVYAAGFSNPASVAVDAAGNLFVIDSAVGTLYEVVAGSTTPAALAGGFSNPGAVTVAANGSVYVADTGNGRIVQFQRSAFNPQTIAFNSIPAQAVGSTLTVTATASSGLPVAFSVVPNGNCSIAGSIVTFLNVGNCGVIANQAGSLTYAAAPGVGQIIVVNSQASQTITFNPIPAQSVGRTLAVSATASSGLAVTFFVVPNGNCSIAGNVVTFLNVGSCGVVASQAGSQNYAAAPAVGQIIAVNNPAPQAITFSAIAAQTVGTPLTLRATATSGLAVSFGSSTGSICAVSGTSVTLLSPGTCTIVASQPGNSTYAAATPVTQSFTVNGNVQSQAITFNPIPAQAVGATLTVSATASSGLAVTFTIVPNGNCSLSGSVVTFLNAGNCGVIASQAGNSSYAAAPAVGQIIVVNNSASQTITFNAIPAQKVGASLTVSASASSGLPVTFSIVPNGNCSLSGSSVTFLNPGNCGVVASQAGNNVYSPAAAVGQIIAVSN